MEEKFGGWLAHTQPLNRAVPRGQIREAKGIQQTQEMGTGLKREEKLQIQSQYVNWQKNGWKNAKKQPVANQDLWEQLIRYFEMPEVDFVKVKGHAGNH